MWSRLNTKELLLNINTLQHKSLNISNIVVSLPILLNNESEDDEFIWMMVQVLHSCLLDHPEEKYIKIFFNLSKSFMCAKVFEQIWFLCIFLNNWAYRWTSLLLSQLLQLLKELCARYSHSGSRLGLHASPAGINVLYSYRVSGNFNPHAICITSVFWEVQQECNFQN